MENDVVIVVPLYKAKLSRFDKISLQQLYKILGNYPIYYVMPERMKTEKINMSIRGQVYYPDRFFQSVQSYSRLCLESFFYETFKKYKYMLIYQTDAFVFSLLS